MDRTEHHSVLIPSYPCLGLLWTWAVLRQPSVIYFKMLVDDLEAFYARNYFQLASEQTNKQAIKCESKKKYLCSLHSKHQSMFPICVRSPKIYFSVEQWGEYICYMTSFARGLATCKCEWTNNFWGLISLNCVCVRLWIKAFLWSILCDNSQSFNAWRLEFCAIFLLSENSI